MNVRLRMEAIELVLSEVDKNVNVEVSQTSLREDKFKMKSY